MTECYKILELDFDATEKDLKDSFRRLSKKYHPDKNGGSNQFIDKFRQVRNAYEKVLVFMKSTSHSTWKFKQSCSKEKSSNYSEKPSQQEAAGKHTSHHDKQREGNQSTDEHFNFYEFVNNDGIYEEDLFKNNLSSVQKQFSLHDIVLTDKFEYKLLNFRFAKELGSQFYKTMSDGVYLIVELEIKNVSKTMLSIHNYMYRLFDFDGYFYEFSSKGLSTMNFMQEPIIPFFGKELNPKIKSTHRLIFEVPEIGDYFIQLCGGSYQWDNDNICICDEVAIVKLNNGYT